jgi:hypothetical protein
LQYDCELHSTTSPHIRHVNSGKFHSVGQAFVEVRGQAFQKSCKSVLILGHPSDSDRPKMSWGGETSDHHVLQDRDCAEDAWKFSTSTTRAPISFFVMNIFTSFLKQPTPFPYIPFCYCIFNTHFNDTPVDIRRINIFYVSNRITDRTLQVAGFSNFSPLKSKANGEKIVTA